MKIVQNFRHDFVEHLRATKWFCIGWLILAGLAVTVFGLAVFAVPAVLVIGCIALIVAAAS